jgi:hypothetical protein
MVNEVSEAHTASIFMVEELRQASTIRSACLLSFSTYASTLKWQQAFLPSLLVLHHVFLCLKIKTEVLPSHRQMCLLINPQDVPAQIGHHLVILSNKQMLTEYI